MHRTEGPDYVTESGKRRYAETVGSETVVNKFHMNALQEEICLAIENTGMTINATGAADRSAGWGQLYTAMLRAVLVDVTSYGADATGVADSTTAFNNALAKTGAIFVPVGDFRLDGALTLPDGGMILGAGKGSVLQFNTTADKLSITNQDFTFSNFVIEDGGASPNQYGIKIVFSADKTVNIDNVEISGMQYNLAMQAGTSHQGRVIGKNITLGATIAGGTSLQINATGGTTYACKNVSISNLKSVQNSADVNVEMNGDATNGGRVATIRSSYITEGKLNFNYETDMMWVIDSVIDMDSYNFTASEGGGFKDCIILGNETNTVNNNQTAASRTFWINVRDADGTIDHSNNYKGIYTKRRATGNASVADGSIDNIDFNTEDSLEMARNASYTKDTVWDNVNKRFDVIGYGNGRLNCFIDVTIDIDDSATYPPATYWWKTWVIIRINGTVYQYVPLVNHSLLAGADSIKYSCYTTLPAVSGEYIEFEVANQLAVGGTDTITIDDATVILEGL